MQSKPPPCKNRKKILEEKLPVFKVKISLGSRNTGNNFLFFNTMQIKYTYQCKITDIQNIWCSYSLANCCR